MTDQAPEQTAVISVRGDAEAEVAPDSAQIAAHVRVVAGSKVDALQTAAARVDALEGALRELGGVPRTASSGRVPLAWVAYSVSAVSESRWGKGKETETGRFIATVNFRLVVRDFALLDEVNAALAAVDGMELHYVQWRVDSDNPGWRQVRADAIAAALDRGRDYAAALGGALLRIEQVADVGLLGDNRAQHLDGVPLSASFGAAWTEEGSGMPTLDPVPQVLRATIDARVLASVAALE